MSYIPLITEAELPSIFFKKSPDTPPPPPLGFGPSSGSPSPPPPPLPSGFCPFLRLYSSTILLCYNPIFISPSASNPPRILLY